MCWSNQPCLYFFKTASQVVATPEMQPKYLEGVHYILGQGTIDFFVCVEVAKQQVWVCNGQLFGFNVCLSVVNKVAVRSSTTMPMSGRAVNSVLFRSAVWTCRNLLNCRLARSHRRCSKGGCWSSWKVGFHRIPGPMLMTVSLSVFSQQKLFSSVCPWGRSYHWRIWWSSSIGSESTLNSERTIAITMRLLLVLFVSWCQTIRVVLMRWLVFIL